MYVVEKCPRRRKNVLCVAGKAGLFCLNDIPCHLKNMLQSSRCGRVSRSAQRCEDERHEKKRRSYAEHNVPVVSSDSWTEPCRSKRPRNAVSGGSATAVSAAAGAGKKAAAVGAAPRWSIPQGIRSAVAGDSAADTDIERVRVDVMSTLNLTLVGEICKSDKTREWAFTLPTWTASRLGHLRSNTVTIVRWQQNLCFPFRRRSRQNYLHSICQHGDFKKGSQSLSKIESIVLE
jgi:hypothetical protein